MGVGSKKWTWKFLVCLFSKTSQFICCKQDRRRAIDEIYNRPTRDKKQTNNFCPNVWLKCFSQQGKWGFQINQSLRMSLKGQRIYEWWSTNGDMSTPSRQVAARPWKGIHYNSSAKQIFRSDMGFTCKPRHQKITSVYYSSCSFYAK